ncbi:MAG: hypothetical protein ABEI39_01175 [Halobacteriales archaeon]
MMRVVPFLALLLVVGAAAPVVGGAAADAPVTLTVSVQTPDGDPVADARLNATWSDGSRTERTAANGKAFVDVPQGADVTIRVDHPDYVRNFPLTVSDASAEQVNVTVYPKASARLTVTDADGRVENVLVRFIKRGRVAIRAKTGPDGRVETGEIEAGNYTIALFKAGYFRKSLSVDIGEGFRRTVRLEQGSVPLTVNVSDDHFSPPRPVSGARVRVVTVGTVQTQADGSQQISVPVNSKVTVEVTKDGYRSTTRKVGISERPTRANLTIQRVPALTLEPLNDQVVAGQEVPVDVVDEYGDPVANATILVDGEAVATTGPDGEALVPIQSPGDRSLRARKNGVTSSERTVRGIAPTATATASPPATTMAATTTTGGTGTTSPGFGPALALLAVAALALGLASRASPPK